ncbi:MAG TPA: phosphate ABC transporter substrate-binding protein [Vulgatibacter sp.]|nr:phosphate ABC transporter substrate-binding protein [Vulgatibacter sp.]
MTLRLIPALTLSALLVACSSKSKDDEGGATPARAAAVTIKGSDTMILLAQRLAERFMEANDGHPVQVTGGGSGTGIAALINGTTDIANASRAMKPAEESQVQQRRGKPAVEHAVALDGIAVYVHESNPLPSITLAQLKAIYEGEVRNWKDVGGPDARIVLYGRENNSGTYAYFKEHVLDDEDFTADTQTLPGTAAVVNAVAKDVRAIGYGGIAFGKGIRAIPVKTDDAAKAVAPTLETVTDGSYPISRKLFMYTAGEPTGNVKAFLDFALSEEGQSLAVAAGYYPLARKAGGPANVAQ